MRTLAMLLGLLLLAPGSLFAQEKDPSRFGVTFSFAPLWTAEERLVTKLIPAIDEFDFSGNEFRFGVIIRGRKYGGEWGISYIRKNISSSSTVTVDKGGNCFGYPAECYENNDWYNIDSGTMRGFEIHSFSPLVTIKRRVQIGTTVGGGLVKMGGKTQLRSLRYDSHFDPATRDWVITPINTSSIEDISEYLKQLGAPAYLPAFRLEATVGVILPQGMKIRLGGGLNFPGYEKFNISLVYLF
jgi:hypothetical protein